MKANELRIGNWIQDGNHFKGYFQVIRISDQSVENADFILTYDEVLPIPLTEEWLLHLGFQKHDSLIIPSYSKSISYSGNLKEISVFISPGNEYVHLREGENNHPTTVDTITTLLNGDYHGRPFYVHQLQNLYFALTGKELTPLNIGDK